MESLPSQSVVLTPEAIEGIKAIASERWIAGSDAWAFKPEVRAAISAGLADDLTRNDEVSFPMTRLNEMGRKLAIERGFLVPCACPGCKVLVGADGTGQCNACTRYRASAYLYGESEACLDHGAGL